jgi:hypothetical protein
MEGSPAAAREGAAGTLAGGRAPGDRLGFHAVAARRLQHGEADTMVASVGSGGAPTRRIKAGYDGELGSAQPQGRRRKAMHGGGNAEGTQEHTRGLGLRGF